MKKIGLYNKWGYILYYARKKNKSPNALCFEDLYNLVLVECGGNIDTSLPLSFIYFLEDMAHEDDNITFVNVEQEMELFF